MKILVMNDLLQGGGVEKLMYDLVTAFHNQYEITIMTDDRDPDFETLYPENVNYIIKNRQEYPNPRNKIERKLIEHKRWTDKVKYIQEIKDMQFDVLLCMKEGWTMFNAIDLADAIPVKIAWNHTDYSKSYYTKNIFHTAERELRLMKRFNQVVCVSQVIEDSIKMLVGDPGNLKVLYNPLDAEVILEKSREEVIDIGKTERPLFVTVGRLNIQKGYDILLEVCNLLNHEGYQYDVWIIGGGESWNDYEVLHDLENKIRKFNLKNVYLLGAKDNPYKYMKQGDWFLSTSRYEGYSYVSQEAAIIGTPLLLTECSGVAELLEKVESGIVVENSVKGIYCGMRQAIEHPSSSKEYADKMKHMDTNYYWSDRIDAIEKLFADRERSKA